MSNGFIGQVNIGSDEHLIGSTFYGTCDTAAGTGPKQVVLQGDALFTGTPKGITIHVKFTNNNTVTNNTLTMAVKTGTNTYSTAYAIENPNGALTWNAGSVISFTLVAAGTDSYKWIMNTSQVSGSSLSGVNFGNIKSTGVLQDTDVTIASGDKLVITDADSSPAGKVARASLTFDGTTTTKYLSPKGEWVEIDPSIAITAGTGSNAPKINVTVNGITGTTAQELTKASTSVYGATKLSAAANDASLAATAKSVYDLGQTVNGLLASADALVYKGTIAGLATTQNSGAGALTQAAAKGDTYKVSASGYVNGIAVEAGDMIICNTDNTAAATTSNYTTIASNWDVIQTNLINAVTSDAGTNPAGYIAKFKSANVIEKGPLIATGGTGYLKEDGSWGTPVGTRDPGYGKITPGNNASIVSALTGNTTQISAGTYNENVKFTGANKWIVLAGNSGTSNGNDEIKFAHFVPSTAYANNGPSSNQTGTRGSTFNIPKITIDEAGHVTGISSITVSLPASDNTDEKVKQSPYTDGTNDKTFNILFKHTNNDTEETDAVYYSTVSSNKLTFNPKSGTLAATKFSGSGAGLKAKSVPLTALADYNGTGTKYLRQDGWKTITLATAKAITSVSHNNDGVWPTFSGGVAATFVVSSGILTITAGSDAAYSTASAAFPTVDTTDGDFANGTITAS